MSRLLKRQLQQFMRAAIVPHNNVVLKDFARWINAFGSPTEMFLSEDKTVISFKFKNEQEVIIAPNNEMVDNKILPLSTFGKQSDSKSFSFEDNALVAGYLQGTNLHSFYASCVDFKDKYNDCAEIRAYFTHWSGSQPVNNIYMKSKDKIISLIYVSAEQSITVLQCSK